MLVRRLAPCHKIDSQRRHVSIRPHARFTFKGLQRFIIHEVEKSLLNNAIIQNKNCSVYSRIFHVIHPQEFGGVKTGI
jgi:hypothetical protein